MSWTKTTFNHTLITSQFLNELQDYIISLENRIAALEAQPKVIPYQEERANQLPVTLGETATVTLQECLLTANVVVGDIFLGTDDGTLVRVTATDNSQTADVIGLGERIGVA